MSSNATCDKEALRQAFNDVRDDKSETNWAIFKYDGNVITFGSSGASYDDFVSAFDENERLFAYLRVITGDALSKRAKFAFITWIGQKVGPIKRAKVSIEKSLVKEVITAFAVEVAASDASDLQIDTITELIIKAGGANYGNGTSRD